MRVFKVFLILFVFAVGQAEAVPNNSDDDCEAFLQATPLIRTIQPTYLIEVEAGGWIVRKDETIPPLGTGFYIFLINSRGETLLAPKYDAEKFLTNGRGLATHKSLLRMYEEETLASTTGQIVAAGEFQIAFGAVVDISNRSGNFRNRFQRLKDAVPYLVRQGLSFDPDATPRAIDPTRPEDRGHTPADRNVDEYHLEGIASLETHPLGTELKVLYGRLHELIVESFPANSARGSLAAMLRTVSRGARQAGGQPRTTSFYYPLLTAYNRDGLEFGLLTLLREGDWAQSRRPEKDFTVSIPEQINNILLGAEDSLTPELKQRWRALARDFSSLRER